MVMTSSRRWRWILPFTVAVTLAAVLISAEVALGSQGPGGGPGTASPFTQLVVAIIVYGGSALIVGAGLIGALRKH
jgi:hypothetical protein